MGVVYRAFDERLKRTVALKTLLADGRGDPKRFRVEAEAAARLRHPAIVSVFDVGEIEGTQYISMDFIEGSSLEKRLKAGKDKLPLTKALEILRDVARAVDYAHSQGVFHRDLKPHNVMLDSRDRPFVLDFGLARLRDSGETSRLTKTGAALGTPAYMPPEQAGGEAGEVDARSDVYSLGATLYEVLTGKPPFHGAAEYNVIIAVLTKDPIPPGSLNARAKGDLETICLRCLEKEKEKRYPSAAAFADEIDRHLAGEPIEARPIGALGRARRWVRRNRALTGAAVVVALVLVGSLGFLAREKNRWEKDELEAARAEAVRLERRFQDWRSQEGDRPIALGLDALAAALRVRALAPQDRGARASAFETAFALGEVAIRSGQWSLATHAFERARELGVDEARVKAALACVDAERTKLETDHRKAIEKILEEARTGALADRPDGFDDALFVLVGLREAQTVKLLAAELDRLARKLPKLADNEERSLRLLCLGLGRIGIREGAVPALGAYLDNETNERRAIEAGIALCRLGGDAASAHVVRARQRFGVSGAFWTQVSRFARKLGGTLEAEAGPRELSERAISRSAQGDHDGAIADLTKAIDRDPSSASHWAVRGYCKYLKDDWDGAIADCSRALELDPHELVAWNTRGMARAEKGDPEGALADVSRAIELDPRDFRFWTNRGKLKTRARDAEGALADISRAIELKPDFAEAWFMRGEARWLKQDQGAIDDYSRAIELDPRLAFAWNARGSVKFAKQDWDGAIADLSRAIEIDPRYSGALANRAAAKFLKNDHDGAIADATRVLELDPASHDAVFTRGFARLKKGETEGGLSDLERFLELAPNDARAASARVVLAKLKKR
ncbi:tetratricopeptide repeat protein [bacterium]|nr:tetratricopeptide repeat protein [bacterium]